MDQPAVAAPGTPLLVAENLRKTYRRGPEQVRALAGASLSLRPGEIVVLLGRSGSGKTTLLNVICGWERPDEGTLRFAPELGADGRVVPWSALAIVPQDLGLFDHLTIGDNVELPLRLAGTLGKQTRHRAGALLRPLGLEGLGGRLPAECSLGERQRASVARAMILQPLLLIADEPTGHQDEGSATEVLRALRWMAGKGTSCLLATHSEETLPFADRVLRIRDGAVTA